jgi:hypothetical protein
MPFIQNRYLRGKWIFLCPLLLFSIITHAIGSPLIIGNTIDPDCKRTWDSLVAIVKNKDSLMKVQIGSIKDSKDVSVAAERLKLVNREERLEAAKLNLNDLENSDIMYAVDLVDRTKVDETGTSMDVASHMIVFVVVDITTFIHETTHGGQFEQQSIAYKKDNGGPFGDDIQDEIEAYQAEFAYEPDSVSGLRSSSKPLVLHDITAKWVRHLTKPDGSQIYGCNGSARIAQLTVSMTSSRHRILRAYRCVKDRKQRWKKGYKPITDANLFYKELKPRMGA